MKKIVVGLFAHVDAGKTTLSESILYNTGTIKQIGRVDNKNTFLDFDKVERERGITVFSKQAILKTENSVITILDTPGHIDFSTEAERTVQVLDYAVLIISARDGIQAHTETLWKILKKYGIPTIFFVNKMDLEDVEEDNLFEGISSKLSEHSVDFSKPLEDNLENIAMCSEDSLEEYLQTGTLNQSTISKLISERKLFPIYFGSALKNIGVRELIEGMDTYMLQKEFLSDFSAKVFKITHDKQGNRLTHMKITGGSLKVKSLISYNPIDSEELIQEKVNMIRLYSGDKFETCEEAESGFICAVTGLNYTFSGQGLGSEQKNYSPVLEPVMSYNVILPDGMDSVSFLPKIKIMEEEDPQLKVGYDEITKSISVHLMGDIQSEILKRQISERFGIDINFGDGKILYKETIINPVEGIGHYEPLRHYAEVHLLIEPIATGSGIVVSSNCSEDVLDRNWQHLILSHICEKTHKGVLIGAPLTDVRISLIVGRAHIKHTEGGDFRQATYRAIRQGLMKAESIILEPYYLVKINLPSQTIGHAITDIKNMGGMILSTNLEGNNAVIEARAPVSEIQHYFINLMTYTKGQGNISYVSDGYRPCHNQEKIIKEIGYDPETDLNNTPDSVFCSHGAGVNIKWYDIEKYMHLSSGINFDDNTGIPLFSDIKVFKRNFDIDEKELEEIMDREFGPIRRKQYSSSAVIDVKVPPNKEKERKSYCYIVDGYNLIGSWDALKKASEYGYDMARHLLMELLANYKGFVQNEVILVFDGYKVKDNIGEKFDYHGINVVYTKENETADMYIEHLIGEIGKNYNVKVITSDNLIQVSALRSGVLRMSSREFVDELMSIKGKIDEILDKYGRSKGYKPFENLD